MKCRLTMFPVVLLLLSVSGPSWSGTTENKVTEHEVIVDRLDSFLRASYARDAVEAYEYISQADRAAKSQAEYVAENGDYSGFTLKLSKRLASGIKLNDIDVSVKSDRATVKFDAVLPDANHPSLNGIVQGFNSHLLEALEPDAQASRLEKLGILTSSNRLAVLESYDEQWELIREDGQWRVFVNWAAAIEVSFGSMVSESLGWKFYPTQALVLAQPGETIQMSYIAVNIGNKATTGKARHTIGALAIADHLEIVACFCFLQQTLAVGESVELPLVFRVDYEVPESVQKFTVDYEFFLESEFPEKEMS